MGTGRKKAKMAKPKGGLTKWFKEGWVDISRKRKGGGLCHAVVNQQGIAKGDTQNAFLLVKPQE